MTPFLITFRETLEIVLVIATLYSLVTKMKIWPLKKYLWLGVFAGVVLSGILAIIFKLIVGGLDGEIQEMVEFGASIVGVVMISMTILFIGNTEQFNKFVLQSVDQTKKRFTHWWMFILVFLTIMRDGVETIIFLFNSNQSAMNILGYGGLGILLAILFGLAFYRGLIKTSLSYFFKVTNILLLLFAANMFSHLFEELEGGMIMTLSLYLVYFILFGFVYRLKQGKKNAIH